MRDPRHGRPKLSVRLALSAPQLIRCAAAVRVDLGKRALSAGPRFAPRRSDGPGEELLRRFLEQLQGWGYTILPLAQAGRAICRWQAFLRYDVLPTSTDAEVASRVAALHQQLRVPGTFHIAWDLTSHNPHAIEAVSRLRELDPDYVHLGLHCDPISEWLASTRFGGDPAVLERFLASPEFTRYLDAMLSAWQEDGAEAPALSALREGAWSSLVALDRSFRQAAGRCSSLSGRRSPLTASFARACRVRPELKAIAAWLQPLDFLAGVGLEQLGYAFEATRFARDREPGPTVLFGGAEVSSLRHSLETRVAGGGGFVAIFPVRHWRQDRYADLLSAHRNSVASAAGSADRPIVSGIATEPLPDRPILTNLADLVGFGPRCELIDKRQLAEAARRKIGGGVDRSFPRFVGWLRGEGYAFAGFEDGPPRFRQRLAYLRHDVHIQDVLAAYVLADLHEELGVVGSFQIMWRFSRYEEMVEPYFVKLLEFDRRYVQFGLHVAPTATWYINEKLGGDYTKQREAVNSDDFVAWLLELNAAFERDGDMAPGLRELRKGTDDVLSTLAASFRATFGDWKSISGHGNFLTNGFAKATAKYPQIKALRRYFVPVTYLSEFGVARFGFDFETTFLGRDRTRLPRMVIENQDADTRRRLFRSRMANGAGFVVLLHPATWTCSHNATFFLPAENTKDA